MLPASISQGASDGSPVPRFTHPPGSIGEVSKLPFEINEIRLRPGAVIADISCDIAGAVETTRPTIWADPVYEIAGIRHFCVDNIPGAVPVSASAGYATAILPFLSLIADSGHSILKTVKNSG